MGKEPDNKFTWVIKDLHSMKPGKIYSDTFVKGGCKWRLMVDFKGSLVGDLPVYLDVPDPDSLPSGWGRCTGYRLSVVNQFDVGRVKWFEVTYSRGRWFHQNTPTLEFHQRLPLTRIYVRNGGYLVNGKLTVVAEVDVLEVIGETDVTIDLLNRIKQLNKSVDVNGFQVLPAQVESVRRIFKKYPDFACNLRPMNQHLKSTYMNVVLGLVEMLCKSPQEISDDDVEESSNAVTFVAKGGFNVNWLEKMLGEVKAKKKKHDSGKAKLQVMEEELLKYNQKCLELKTLLEKEFSDVSAACVPLSFDDAV